MLVSVATLVLLASDLVLHGPITQRDPAVSQWAVAHRTAAATTLFLAVTHLHSTAGIDLMLAGLAAILALRRHWRIALWLILCVQGAMFLNILLKNAFQRVRPALEPLVHLSTYSFPSGHALAATVWWGCVVALALALSRRPSVHLFAACAAVALVALTCASRVYVGAHYLSDVLAGVSEGLAWLSAWAIATGWFSTRPDRLRHGSE